MIILARLIGFAMMVMGTSIAINPNIFKTIINFWRKGKNIYLAGALRLVFAAIFLLAAPACRFSTVISILGVLMIIGGVIIFAIGPKRIQAIFNWWEKKPPLVMRLMGLIALTMGSLVIYSI